MSNHSSSNVNDFKSPEGTSHCFFEASVTPHSETHKSGAFCAFNRQVHSLQIPKGNSFHLNYDSKSPLHRWAASDRLRLIHFLQEIQLDRALDVLPDNCTYEDLFKCPLEELRNVLSGCLTELEVNSLYSHLHSCTSIGKHETESRSHLEDPHVRRERPGSTCGQHRPRTSLGSLSCASAESSSIFIGDKPLDNTNSITSGENECNCDCDLSKSDLVQLSTSVKRASSLGSDNVSQILPNYRPSSLSISSALTDSHSLSLQEDANTNSITGPVPCLAQANLSTSEVWKNSQSPRNISPKQQINTNTYSEASSVSYAIPSFYRHGSNEPQLSPYFSSHLSNYETNSRRFGSRWDDIRSEYPSQFSQRYHSDHLKLSSKCNRWRSLREMARFDNPM
ncbi:unnamed protein product [Trichobilharzia regenti]|nr:unnamed protein product [Trichobilharzia regenti]